MKILSEKVLSRNVIFVSLDCATKWIVDKLISDGELPNLSKLIDNGSYFNMDSGDLVMSAVVWTSIATGKLPAKHGVQSFFATADTIKTKRMWDIFEDHGKKVGIMGYFLSWPPKKVNGFMIPALLAIDDTTYPPEYSFLHQMTVERKTKKNLNVFELLKYALIAFKCGARFNTLFSAGLESLKNKMLSRDFRDEVYNARVLKQKLYSDIFLSLHKKFKPDLATFHNHLVDTTSHDYWRYFEPEKFTDVTKEDVAKYGGRLYDAYRKADKTLGKILKLKSDDTLVIVASDHGAKSMVESADIGHTPLVDSEKLMQALGIEKDVSYSSVSYYIIVKPRLENDVEKQKLKELFSSIHIIGQETPLFNLYKYDDVNVWLRVNNNLTSLKGLEVNLNGQKYSVEEFVRTAKNKVSGTHDGKTAILSVSGKGVKKGFKGDEPIDVFDVVPTLLTLMNMPIGKDMDGRVLTEAIEEDFLNKYPVKYIDTYDDSSYDDISGEDMEVSKELKDQLKALGYL